MQYNIAGDITKGRIGMCGCIVEKFGEVQGSFIGSFCLCSGKGAEGNKHFGVDCTAVME